MSATTVIDGPSRLSVVWAGENRFNNADSRGRIAWDLTDYVQNNALHKTRDKGRKWYQGFVIERPLRVYVKNLREKV